MGPRPAPRSRPSRSWWRGERAKALNSARSRAPRNSEQNCARSPTKSEEHISALKRKEYSVGDALESDQYMVSAIDRRKPEARAPGEKPAQTRVRKAAVTTADPSEFRRQMVTIGPMRHVGVGELQGEKRLVAFYAIVRGLTVEDRVAYVRHLNPLRLARPGTVLAVETGDALARTTTPIFAMDDRCDLVIRSDQIDIVNKTFSTACSSI